MTTKLNKRDMLRKKQLEKKRKKLIKTGVIVFGIISVFLLAAFLPKIIIGMQQKTNQSGFEIGNPNAKVTVELFSNYSCGFCGLYNETMEKDFISKYVDTENVFYRYILLPYFDESAEFASVASYCADEQNAFFIYKDLVYANASNPNAFTPDNLTQYAIEIGLDVEKFQTCLVSDTYKDAVNRDRAYASSAGVTFTPAFLINGEVYQANELDATLDLLLSE